MFRAVWQAPLLYRLKALSSPKAFFTGEEAMLSVGKNPGPNSTMLPWTTFYIPNYSKSTNRDYILSVVGYGSAMNSTVIVDEFSELFGFCNKYEATITFESKNYEQSTKVYPTVELDIKRSRIFQSSCPNSITLFLNTNRIISYILMANCLSAEWQWTLQIFASMI